MLQPYKPVEQTVRPVNLLAVAVTSRQYTVNTKRSTDVSAVKKRRRMLNPHSPGAAATVA